MTEPVCSTCNDTHKMTLHYGYEEREVMCTRCPTPCQDCRAGGNGPFCGATPCNCRCHVAKDAIAHMRRVRGLELALGRFAHRARLVADGRQELRRLCQEYLAATETPHG